MGSWGGPDFTPDWPDTDHGIHVDREGNVWIAGNGRTDREVLKFTAAGEAHLAIGRKSDAPVDNKDTTLLGRPEGYAGSSAGQVGRNLDTSNTGKNCSW